MAQSLSREILQAALAGLRLQEQHIQNQISEVESMLGGESSASEITPSETLQSKRGKRKQFSAATKKRMAEAQRQRWARLKGDTAVPESAPEPAPKKRRMSKEGRAAIVAAAKRRWAEKRASEATTEKAPSKRATQKKASVRVQKSVPAKKVATKKRRKTRTSPVAATPVAPADVR
jgi:hypothetical protein